VLSVERNEKKTKNKKQKRVFLVENYIEEI